MTYFFPITYYLHWIWSRCLDSTKKLLQSNRSWQSWQAKRLQLWFRFCWWVEAGTSKVEETFASLRFFLLLSFHQLVPLVAFPSTRWKQTIHPGDLQLWLGLVTAMPVVSQAKKHTSPLRMFELPPLNLRVCFLFGELLGWKKEILINDLIQFKFLSVILFSVVGTIKKPGTL